MLNKTSESEYVCVGGGGRGSRWWCQQGLSKHPPLNIKKNE